MGSDLQRPVDRSLSTDQSLGEEFSPAGAGCRYRAPLTPRLARPFFPRVLSCRRTSHIFARRVSAPAFRAAGLPTRRDVRKSHAAARRSASTPKYTTRCAQSKAQGGLLFSRAGDDRRGAPSERRTEHIGLVGYHSRKWLQTQGLPQPCLDSRQVRVRAAQSALDKRGVQGDYIATFEG